MTTGIPGAGIGGLFYLAHALLLPFRGLSRSARGEPVVWRPILSQAGIAAGVLLAIWTTGWLVGAWLAPGSPAASPVSSIAGAGAASTARLLGAATLLMSVGTLAVVLLSVQLARWFFRRPR